jgi:hypothetical protein
MIRGLVETDFARQRRKGRPDPFAMILPSMISRESLASEADRNRFEPLRNRMSEYGSERAAMPSSSAAEAGGSMPESNPYSIDVFTIA